MSDQPNFIPHIDDANVEVQRLEEKFGLPKSEFIPNVAVANERVALLNKKLGEGEAQEDKPVSGTAKTASPPALPPLKAEGLQRAIAANGGQKTDLTSSAAPLTGLARAIAGNSAKQGGNDNNDNQAVEAARPTQEVTGLQRAIAAASRAK